MVRKNILYFIKIMALAVFALPAIPLQGLFIRFNLKAQTKLPVLFHRYTAFIVGLRVKTVGTLAKDRPLMLVSNHVSWLDIIALSAVCPVSFIAKSEVESWGIFGLFARLQRSVFVDRQRRSATKNVTYSIAQRLKAEDVMVLFGEGTTGDGISILPFKSSLIGVTHDIDPVWFQPVSIAYTKLNGLPAGHYDRAHTAWYGDMELLPHLRNIMTGGAMDATVSFGKAYKFEPGAGRKIMTKNLEASARKMTYDAHFR